MQNLPPIFGDPPPPIKPIRKCPLGMVQTMTSKSLKKFGTCGTILGR